jgi:fucose 4-O-acetylase-like acetyltransferase
MSGGARQRSAAIDAVRVLGVVAVVAGHVWGEVPVVRALLFSWHVPVFFLLSGYLASSAPVGVLARRRATSLLLPYATWLVLITLLLPGVIPIPNLLLGGAYLPRPYSAFWFVTALFVAVVVAALLERMPLSRQWVIAGAVLLVAYLVGPALAQVPLDAGVGVVCVVFVVAGRTLRHLRDTIRRPVVVGSAAVLGGLLLAGFGVVRPLDLKYADFGTPVASVVVAIAISAGLVLVAEGVLRDLSAGANALITRVALGGFMVVLSHTAVLYAIGFDGTGRMLAFALSLGVPWIAALVVLVTPLALPLTGVRRQPLRVVESADSAGPR